MNVKPLCKKPKSNHKKIMIFLFKKLFNIYLEIVFKKETKYVFIFESKNIKRILKKPNHIPYDEKIIIGDEKRVLENIQILRKWIKELELETMEK